MTASASRKAEKHALVVLLNGKRVGDIHQSSPGTLRFSYLKSWQEERESYPLSLSMPLSVREHRHEAIAAFLWGLLPDNELTLERYGRLFSVSPRNPVAILQHLGADCAGAVQFASPENADALEGDSERSSVEWLTESQIEQELRSVRQYGVSVITGRDVGQFSLAGAQPKIALLEDGDRWGQPSGRTPTNRILKPPAGDFEGFAENEHFCLELANELGLGAAKSRIKTFGQEVAIVVDRFDRQLIGGKWMRIHQEDVCQALQVMPTLKYEKDGGPGIAAIVAVLQESSIRPQEDVERFLKVTALNWVTAATDAHAKNFSLLHSPDGVRLAPFYDLLSYLPYSDERLHRVTLAMKLGREYHMNRVARRNWTQLARIVRVTEDKVIDSVETVLKYLPEAIERTAARAVSEGLDSATIKGLRERLMARVTVCVNAMEPSH